MVFLAAAGILCILYYFIIIIYSGPKETFSMFWVGAGCFLGLLALCRAGSAAQNGGIFFIVIKGIIAAAGVCVLLLFIYVEAKIFFAASGNAYDGAQTVIILGAQVWGRIPSKSLYRRVSAGAAYLHRNPGARVIVSGGRGPGEDISEACCMEMLLVEMGIEKGRIFLEEDSGDTYENIRNSLQICGREQSILIVTCGYHMYRALALAKKAGVFKVYGCPVKSNRLLLINYYVREFFAVLKYKAAGQI